MGKMGYTSADKTRLSILKAAKTLFVRHGYAGTSMANVASLAKVNRSLIFHHFKNKLTLWKATKQYMVDKQKHCPAPLPPIDLPIELFIHQMIKNLLAYYKKNPALLRMVHWQQLEAINNKKEKLAFSSGIDSWIDAIKHYQNSGGINSKLKPAHVATFILSVTSSYALTPNPLLVNDEEAYIDFCIQQLINGLCV
ncbi:MAG: hypothetical protein DHS20C10_02750 [marine bacterium B5-7]|nr:MAG: hypothetical protein DHS20C10_02750 [marine bacterium B5-7]